MFEKGNRLYVRFDYKTGENDLTSQDFEDHLAYVKNVAQQRYVVGGGFSNAGVGMIIFEAENYEEAQAVFTNDPIIKKGFYRCDIFVWDLVVTSENIAEKQYKVENKHLPKIQR